MESVYFYFAVEKTLCKHEVIKLRKFAFWVFRLLKFHFLKIGNHKLMKNHLVYIFIAKFISSIKFNSLVSNFRKAQLQ